jgi:hypothetical protein
MLAAVSIAAEPPCPDGTAEKGEQKGGHEEQEEDDDTYLEDADESDYEYEPDSEDDCWGGGGSSSGTNVRDALLETHNNKFGAGTAKCSAEAMLTKILLEMGTSDIDKPTAQCWGVDSSQPIILQITSESFGGGAFSGGGLGAVSAPPGCKVYQPGVDKGYNSAFKLGPQLQNILAQYLNDMWKQSQESPDKAQKRKRAMDLAESTPEVQKKVEQLEQMGFDQESAVRALKGGDCSLVEAMDELLTNPTTTEEQKNATSCARMKMSVEQTSNEKERAWRESLALEEEGILVQISHYMRARLLTVNSYCVICDRPPLFSAAMIKPSVCPRELCAFSFSQLGVMSEAADEIATDAEVVDLLVSIARGACASARRETIFDPFPFVPNPKDPAKPFLCDQTKDFSLAKVVLSKFPSVQEMVNSNDHTQLRQKLEAAHPIAWELLQWIISSNRSHIVGVRSECRLERMGTAFQYLLVMQAPEKERQFQKLKEQHGGSSFAFHGSPPENWHAILRHGLQSMSGTKKQLHGAAHGNGIYLATQAATSIGYSNRQQAQLSGATAGATQDGGNRFLDTGALKMLALCEVVDDPAIKKSSYCWVAPNADTVCTRFFFVYCQGDEARVPGLHSLTTTDPKFVEEIRACISASRG